MTQIDINRKILLIGNTGYGKTYAVHSILKELQKKDYGIFMYDTNAEISNFSDIKGLQFYPTEQSHVKQRNDLNELNKFIKIVRTQMKKPSFLFIDDIESFFFDTTAKAKSQSLIKDLYSRSRHISLGIIVCSKQLTFLPNLILSQSNLLYIGRFDIKDRSSYEKAQGLTEIDLSTLDYQNHEFLKIDSYDNTQDKVSF